MVQLGGAWLDRKGPADPENPPTLGAGAGPTVAGHGAEAGDRNGGGRRTALGVRWVDAGLHRAFLGSRGTGEAKGRDGREEAGTPGLGNWDRLPR